MAFRTWELAPTGWYHMPGRAGRTRCSSPGRQHIRPTVVTNVFTKPNETVDRKVVPPFDYGVFFHGAWDEKAATDYYQTFIAKGTSVTQVGFRLSTTASTGSGRGLRP